jgi:hypothetical protein
MPYVGFKPMIPVFKRVKTVHALDRTTTVISKYPLQDGNFCAEYGNSMKCGSCLGLQRSMYFVITEWQTPT